MNCMRHKHNLLNLFYRISSKSPLTSIPIPHKVKKEKKKTHPYTSKNQCVKRRSLHGLFLSKQMEMIFSSTLCLELFSFECFEFFVSLFIYFFFFSFSATLLLSSGSKTVEAEEGKRTETEQRI